MPGATALRVCQVGKETVYGTSVAATAVLMGLTGMSFGPDYANSQRRWLQGNYAPAHATVQTDKRGHAAVNGDFLFEDFPFYGNKGIKGGVAGAVIDTSGYTWTFPFPLTASPALESATWEFYDGSQEYELPGGLVESFSLSGDATPEGVVQFGAKILSLDCVKSTVTGALSTRTVETLPCGMCQLYVDAIGGTVGSTIKADTLISWKLDYDNGAHLKKFMTGSLSPSAKGYNVPSVKLAMTCEFNAASIAEVDAYLANTGRLYRIKGLGTLAGASTAYKTLQIDIAGDVDVNDMWSDRDGNTTVDFTVKARYDTGAFANYGQIVVINKSTTMPA